MTLLMKANMLNVVIELCGLQIVSYSNKIISQLKVYGSRDDMVFFNTTLAIYIRVFKFQR